MLAPDVDILRAGLECLRNRRDLQLLLEHRLHPFLLRDLHQPLPLLPALVVEKPFRHLRRRIDQNERANHLRMLQDEQLRDHSPHRVTDESAFADVEILQQLVDIGGHRLERISVLTRWLRGRPMPAQVHGDHAEALGQRGRGQRPVPRVTRVTVHQDNGKAFTRLAAIDLDIIYGCLRHESPPESDASIARVVRARCRANSPRARDGISHFE